MIEKKLVFTLKARHYIEFEEHITDEMLKPWYVSTIYPKRNLPKDVKGWIYFDLL